MAIPGLNSKVLDKIIDTLGLQSAVEKLPTSLSPTIQPVLEVKPDDIVDVLKTRTGSGAVYTTPTDQDFFLTNVTMLGISTDQDSEVSLSMSVVLESGETVSIGQLFLYSTASSSQNGNYVNNLVTPIKLKRGSNISFVTGATSSRAIIAGFRRKALI